MKILIISSEKRDDFSSTPSLLGLALNTMGHSVSVWRSAFFKKFKTPEIKLNVFKDEINSFDVVIATNCGQQIIDFTGIENKKIFLYFESFDSPILPLGVFDEMWCHKGHLNLFRYCNPLQKKPITTRLIVEPAVAPEHWKSAKVWKERKIKCAFNGALQKPKEVDFLLNSWMIYRYKFCYELRELLHKEGIGIRLPNMKRNTDNGWKSEFRDTKINLHFSGENSVGQGAMETGLMKCALIECVPREVGEVFGLIHDKNCLMVQNVREAFEAIEFLRDNDFIAERLGKELYKFALQHTYLKFIPYLKEILESLDIK